MKSKFKFWAYILIMMALAFTVITLMVVTGNALNHDMPLGFFLLWSLFFCFVWVWLVFGEIRTKVISVVITNDEIRVTRYLRLFSKAYPAKVFDGYRLSVVFDQVGSYEYLYLIIGGKKAIKISEKFHANYKDLKKTIVNNGYKNLGLNVTAV